MRLPSPPARGGGQDRDRLRELEICRGRPCEPRCSLLAALKVSVLSPLNMGLLVKVSGTEEHTYGSPPHPQAQEHPLRTQGPLFPQGPRAPITGPPQRLTHVACGSQPRSRVLEVPLWYVVHPGTQKVPSKGFRVNGGDPGGPVRQAWGHGPACWAPGAVRTVLCQQSLPCAQPGGHVQGKATK